MRDYACTFIGVLSSPEATLVFQIGDGGVVLDTGDGLEVAVEPMTGEYANMTHFITDERAGEIVVAKSYQGPALRIAAFSDGIQRLALNLADNTPHEPFFAPFFQGLAKAPADQIGRLQSLLAAFLGSGPVNERTDDDKSLAVAVWVAGPGP
ncbi:MAG: protein phosphatase protein [Akkermansiaceae bacterium]|nr:protein phosphatase protein [Akkermansiaceae bacterium]